MARWLRGLAGYAALLAFAAIVLVRLGPDHFSSDAGVVQLLAGALFALTGAAAYRLPALGFPARALLATAGAWLAVDEWLMVHECLKFGPLAGLGSLRDAPVLLYGVGAVAFAVLVGWRVRPPREAILHAVAAILAVGVVLLLDVGGLMRGWPVELLEVLEESAELLAAWGAIQCCTAAARSAPSAPWREAVAVGGWSAAWLGVVVWLLKPLGCAERFL
jgi:hypothetical protein